MKDGFGDIIYIILTLLFVIIGLFGKKKPKKPLIAESEDVQDENDSFELPNEVESFFESLNNEIPEEEVQPIKTAQPLEEPVPDSPVSSIENLKNKRNVIAREKNITQQVEHVESIPDYIKLTEMGSAHENNLDYESRSRIASEFDIQKAILYSAILERKYF